MASIVPWQREPGAPRRRWWSRLLRFLLDRRRRAPAGRHLLTAQAGQAGAKVAARPGWLRASGASAYSAFVMTATSTPRFATRRRT